MGRVGVRVMGRVGVKVSLPLEYIHKKNIEKEYLVADLIFLVHMSDGRQRREGDAGRGETAIDGGTTRRGLSVARRGHGLTRG